MLVGRNSRPRIWLLAAAATATLACGGGSPQGGSPPPPSTPSGQRCLLIGIDGAAWDDLEPLLAAGQLPNLERLRREGAWGVLESFHPTASSIVWTSIATGKTPEKHGIKSFVAPLPGGELVPVTSNMRAVEAIWNILSDAGVEVGVVGWWVSWPAEQVRGFFCSDYTWPLKKDRQGFAVGRDATLELSHRTWPEGILAEIEPFLVTPESLSPLERIEMGLDRIPLTGGYAVAEILCKDRSYMEGGLHLFRRHRPDFFAVYLEGVDAFKHLFWPFHSAYRNWRYGDGNEPPPRPQRAVAEVLEIHYRSIDRFLGELLETAGDDTTLMIVSDHGYGDNPGRQPILRTYGDVMDPGPDHWHTLEGMVLLHGGPIRRGLRLRDSSVLDVTPTLLVLLGLPVGADMDGRVLAEAFEPEFLANHPMRTVPTYETGRREAGTPVASPFDREMLERLRALGYLE